jgi:anion-transporting  ArsA/GET3 family ATPase
MEPGKRAIIVSGKGGTGKTTVATALAVAETRRGRSVLLLELEGRQGATRLLGLPDVGFEEEETPFGFSVASLGPREALVEYLGLFFGMRRLARPLTRSKAVEVATEAVPGFRDMMLNGKIYEVAEWRRDASKGRGRPQYDVVIADAPPTGQIVPFLSAPGAFAELIRMGRPRDQARRIDAFLRERCRVVLVTAPEELAVTETLEAHAALEELGMPVGPVVLNRVLRSALPRGTGKAFEGLRPDSAERLLEESGLSVDEDVMGATLDIVRWQRRGEREQQAQVRRLRGVEVVELPYLFARSFGMEQVETLADGLEEVA